MWLVAPSPCVFRDQDLAPVESHRRVRGPEKFPVYLSRSRSREKKGVAGDGEKKMSMLRRIIPVVFATLLALGAMVGSATPWLCASSYPWSGGHDAAGVTTPATTWYFAEGCTREGFDEWLCVMNPLGEPAVLDISFLTPEGNEFQLQAPVAPLSRYTLNVADVVGEGQDVSLVVESDIPVVAERPMYFNYRSPSSPVAYELAEVEGIDMKSPVSYGETTGIMYHEASRYDIHNEPARARVMEPRGGCVDDANPGARYPGWMPVRWGDPYYWIQESRGRGTFSTTAVDVGAKAGCEVLSPVDGVVDTVEEYALYGAYLDHRLTIVPDGDRDLRVVVVHIEARVIPGQRLEAGETVLGRVRPLSIYFRSDIGRYYTGDEGNHVHLQVNLPQ